MYSAATTTRTACRARPTAYAHPLGLPVGVLPGQAHLNPDSGYGPWPSMLDWCLRPASDAYEEIPTRERTAQRTDATTGD